MGCLVVDVGNTSTSAAWASGATIRRVCRLAGVRPGREDVRALLRTARGRDPVHGSVLASVVPAARAVWMEALRAECGSEPIEVSPQVRMPLKIRYPRPQTIGADRLANACAAARRYGCPVIAADFGTATTFDVVSADGAFVGGVIAPGPAMMTSYLADRTAQLPRIGMGGRCGVLGRSTAGAMRIGAQVGYRGLVRELVEHLRAAPGLEAARLCATGGFAGRILRGLDLPFALDPNLTLYGLSLIFDMNA